MPFSFEDTWMCCDGARCPCPNHLGPDWSLPFVFPDAIDSHPSLHHVASGNDCPTGDDEDITNRSIPLLQSQLQATEDASQKLTRLKNALRLELDKVEGEITRLHEHHDTLSRALDCRSRINAPIKRLPSEILTSIFEITISLSSPSSPLSQFLPPSGKPVEDTELDDFALVCRRWRRAVLESPTLWSQIHIDPQASHWRTRSSIGARSLIRRIRLSAQAELDIKFSVLYGHCDDHPLPPLLITLLKQICRRISSLSLDLSSSRIRSLHPLHDSFDSLKYLFVRSYASDTDPPSIQLFEKAPKLVVYDTTAEARIGIPWCQIIRHSACGYTANIHTALEALEDAKNLQTGTFSMHSGSQTPLRIGQDPIICTHLTYLQVNVRKISYIVKNAHPLRQLFQQCSFPALNQLYVSTSGVDVPQKEPDTIDTFHALLLCLQRSRSPLSVLSYDNGPVAPVDVDTFFRTTPTISRVEFTRISSGLSDAAFQSLLVQPGHVEICALRLESLLLEGELEFDAGNFAAVVKSRRDVVPLSSIDFHWHRLYVYAPYDEEKARRWSSEGAVLAEQLDGYEERDVYLGICIDGCVLRTCEDNFL